MSIILYMDKSTKLAISRTKLASIRTLLSYIRTAIVTLSLAAAFVKIGNSKLHDPLIVLAIVLSVACVIIGIAGHLIVLSRVNKLAENSTNSDNIAPNGK